MTPIEALVEEAQRLADPAMRAPLTAVDEVARVLQICNACRYCEGFCAVFPAMTRRLTFDASDAHYLANLCHNCGACLHACQYAAPHEFDVNVPRAMAKVRLQTYSDYAWPSALGRLYQRNGLTLSLALAGGIALFLSLAVAIKGALLLAPTTGNFYSIFPHALMVNLFAPIFIFSVVSLGIGVRNFWRNVAPKESQNGAFSEAAQNALSLRYLDGGHVEGCNERDDRFTKLRRRYHHATFYGFLLCFAATGVATLYHYCSGTIYL